MPRTNIAAQVIPGSFYPATPLGAAAQDLLMTAVDDPTDRDTALIDGKTMVYALNTDSVARTITIGSALDAFNRGGDITAYSIAAGKLARFGPFKIAGWGNGGRLNIDVSSPLVRLMVETLP